LRLTILLLEEENKQLKSEIARLMTDLQNLTQRERKRERERGEREREREREREQRGLAESYPEKEKGRRQWL